MPYKIIYTDKSAFLEVQYYGTVTLPDLENALYDLVQEIGKRKYYWVLADCSEMVGGHSIMDLYYFIEMLEKANVPHTLREAIIQPHLEASVSEVNFYETACLNRGYNVRVFSDREAAEKWLTGQP